MGYMISFTVLCLVWLALLIGIGVTKVFTVWAKLIVGTLLTGLAVVIGYFILFAWAWSNV